MGNLSMNTNLMGSMVGGGGGMVGGGGGGGMPSRLGGLGMAGHDEHQGFGGGNNMGVGLGGGNSMQPQQQGPGMNPMQQHPLTQVTR